MLIRHEIRKLLRGKTKWLVILILLSNLAVYYFYLMPQMQTDLAKTIHQDMVEIGKSYSSMEKACQNVRSDMLLYSQRAGGSKAELSQTEQWMCQKLEKEYQEAINFTEMTEGIDERAKNLLEFSIFSKEGSFSSRNIIKTAEDFRQLKNLSVEPADGSGLIHVQQFVLSDIFIFILICLLAFQLYGTDAASGINKIISSTLKGEKTLLLLQSGLVGGCTACCAFLIYGSNLLQTAVFAGFPDMASDIHGIEQFQTIPFACTTQTYLLIYLAWKVFYSISISFLIQFLVYKMEGTKMTWIIIGGLTVISFLLWFYLPSSPVLKLFRYLNLLGLADTMEIIGSYQNLNLFGFPVELRVAAFALLLILIIASVFLLLYLYPGVVKITYKSKKNPFIKKKRKGLAAYEIYKITGKGKGFLLLFLIVLYAVYTGFLSEQTEYLSKSEYYYEQFSKDLIGKKGEDLTRGMEVLEQQSRTFSAEGQMEAFIQIKEQYDSIKNQEKFGAVFVNARRWERIFCSRQEELQCYLFFVIVVVFGMNGMFQMERKSRIHILIRSTQNGGKVYWYKFGTACIQSILFAILLTAGQLIKNGKMYGFGQREYAVQSIPFFSNIPYDFSLKGMLFLSILQRLLAWLFIAMILFFFSQILLTASQFMIGSCVLFILPGILLYIANMQYKNPLVNLVQTGIEPQIRWYYFLSSWPSVYKDMPFSLIVFLLVAAIVVILVGYKRWQNQSFYL